MGNVMENWSQIYRIFGLEEWVNNVNGWFL